MIINGLNRPYKTNTYYLIDTTILERMSNYITIPLDKSTLLKWNNLEFLIYNTSVYSNSMAKIYGNYSFFSVIILVPINVIPQHIVLLSVYTDLVSYIYIF